MVSIGGGAKEAIFIDMAAGKHFGRFIRTFKEHGQPPETMEVEIRPRGLEGVLNRNIIIHNVPEHGGLVMIKPSDLQGVPPEGLVIMIRGENGESPLYGNKLKNDITVKFDQLQDKIVDLETELAQKIHDKKISHLGIKESLREHAEVGATIEKKPKGEEDGKWRHRRPPYDYEPGIGVEEEDV